MHGSGAKAARAAGYAHTKQSTYKLLRNPAVVAWSSLLAPFPMATSCHLKAANPLIALSSFPEPFLTVIITCAQQVMAARAMAAFFTDLELHGCATLSDSRGRARGKSSPVDSEAHVE